MRDSIGGSMLLYLIVIFIGVVIALFVGILSYSKAYRIKNRIIETIEKYGTYEKLGEDGKNIIAEELNPDLGAAGYDASSPSGCSEVRKKLVDSVKDANAKAEYDKKLSQNLNVYGYNYCVFEMCDERENEACVGTAEKYYLVVSFVRFEFPVINDILTFPVHGETNILGKNYNY